MYENIHYKSCKQCGKEQRYLTRGLCKSCYNKRQRAGEFRGGRTDSSPLKQRLNQFWSNINYRCTNPKDRRYKNYGGRGIENKLTLQDLEFLWFRDGAADMKRPSVDRKDGTGHYELSNCRFMEMIDNKKRGRCILSPCKQCGVIERQLGSIFCIRCADYRRCASCQRFNISRLESLKRFCDECRFVTRPCDHCGSPVSKDRIMQVAEFRNKHWFCNKQCFGYFTAKHFGFGSPNQTAAQFAAQRRAKEI